MRIVTCGGRSFDDPVVVYEALIEYPSATIAHGAANGADGLVGSIARDLELSVEEFPADWGQYGRAAGPIRNRQMLDTEPDLVLAFPGGRGTADCVREAKRRGIAVREVQRSKR